MFSGISAGSFPCVEFKKSRVVFKKPESFQNLSVGDSVLVNGVCLTVEELKNNLMTFALGEETLKITGWTEDSFKNKNFNLENSLTLNQVVGGHLVTGHADGLALIKKHQRVKESLILTLDIPKDFLKFLSNKSYITLNGVSLTVNLVQGNQVNVCVIPKTQELSNLADFKEGESLIFEVDYFARILVNYALKNQ